MTVVAIALALSVAEAAEPARVTAAPGHEPRAIPKAAQSMSEAEALAWLESYDSLDGDAVYLGMMRLPPDVSVMVGEHGALLEDLWWRVCQGSYAAHVTYGRGCVQLDVNRKANELSAESIPRADQAEVERQQVLTWVQCETGVLDETACAEVLAARSEPSNP